MNNLDQNVYVVMYLNSKHLTVKLCHIFNTLQNQHLDQFLKLWLLAKVSIL